ncbi:hypothetical protein ACFQ9J_17370 [Streptomyces sp. NPDC056529]|uniref:hypothetical protein n=1 Tax=Streptomyces sp. NPDC056529 TaxID=3345855 RepID=UPI0036D0DF22
MSVLRGGTPYRTKGLTSAFERKHATRGAEHAGGEEWLAVGRLMRRGGCCTSIA